MERLTGSAAFHLMPSRERRWVRVRSAARARHPPTLAFTVHMRQLPSASRTIAGEISEYRASWSTSAASLQSLPVLLVRRYTWSAVLVVCR
jgi:uncharacterized protein YfaT (DUF1175 family)